MISTSMQDASNITAKCLGYVLQKIDYVALNKGLYLTQKFPHQTHTAILFEYMHSPRDTRVALEERIPGTDQSVHSIVTTLEFMKIINNLFMVDNSVIYNRRKFIDGQPSNVRQILLRTEPDDMPPLISVEQFDFNHFINMPHL